jgi:hypothetical protein
MATLPPALAAYAFMLGSWGDDASGARETWVAAGDRLVGVGFFAPGQGPGFEILEVADGAYLARPGGRPAVAFATTRVREDRAVFENPAHDWPTKIAYERKGDALEAKVTGPGGGGGWRWALRTVTWDEGLLAAERARGRDPLAADVSSDGALGFTVAATGAVTIWKRSGEAWEVASE